MMTYGLTNGTLGPLEQTLLGTRTLGNSSVVVAVVDGGIDCGNQELAHACDLRSEGVDMDGHGTFMAGLVAARTNNVMGIAGTAQVKVLSVAFVTIAAGVSQGLMWDAALAIQRAYYSGAKVISMSWITPTCSLFGVYTCALLEGALEVTKSSMMVAAAGNQNNTSIGFPASSPHVIAVGGTNVNNEHWVYANGGSNMGPELELVAAADALWSTRSSISPLFECIAGNQTYCKTIGGTSSAAAQVSGIVALMLSICPVFLSKEVIRQTLNQTAMDLGPAGWDSTYGWGLVDADAAVQAVSQCG